MTQAGSARGARTCQGVAAADTFEECLRLMHEAVAFHLDGMREDGLPIPVPAAVAAVTIEAA